MKLLFWWTADTEKDGLDFTFIWVHDRGDRRGGIRNDEHETSPRGTGT